MTSNVKEGTLANAAEQSSTAPQSIRLIPKAGLRRILPYSPQHIFRLEKRGLFPRRVQLGANHVGWLLAENEHWIAVRVPEREPAHSALLIAAANRTGMKENAYATMTHDGRAIANFILDAADRDGRAISNLSLQKLVYFCHALPQTFQRNVGCIVLPRVRRGDPLVERPPAERLVRSARSAGASPAPRHGSGWRPRAAKRSAAVDVKDLYADYVTWCDATSTAVVGEPDFARLFDAICDLPEVADKIEKLIYHTGSRLSVSSTDRPRVLLWE